MSNSEPFISVIIPTYNRAHYLSEALVSVRAQTYRAFEIIVVDDGSTDGTVEAARADDVRYFYQENAGCGRARNTGIQHARGPFVAFLDQDDLWPSDKLARQMAVWSELPPSDAPTFIFGHAKQFFSPELSEASRARLRLPAEPQPAPVASTLLTTLADFHRVGPFASTKPDFDWFMRARDGGAHILTLPDIFMFRRVHEANYGRTHKHHRNDYLHALKASLDRRRAAE